MSCEPRVWLFLRAGAGAQNGCAYFPDWDALRKQVALHSDAKSCKISDSRLHQVMQLCPLNVHDAVSGKHVPDLADAHIVTNSVWLG